jgi:formate hydrogenlyase subunit 6/NADH:ubiquinone oxidoreductase subunit I
MSDTQDTVVIGRNGLNALVAALKADGFEVIGPRKAGAAIVYEPLETADDLPAGWSDEQDGGCYRLVEGDGDRMFDYVVGPHSWKRWLYPPEQRLMRARRSNGGFTVESGEGDVPRFALFGVRPCDLAAIRVQDRVFDNGDFADPGYVARRAAAFIVVVNCGRAAGTCFCTSMGTGPKAEGGYDLALTELGEGGTFLLQTGSGRGAAVLAAVPGRPAGPEDLKAAKAATDRAAGQMSRTMVPDVEQLLKRNLESPHWQRVAQRCLGCANCTMVCPTCFCSTVEDTTDLSGDTAERWRKWDSCFGLDFSYIHGGSIRRETSARYRQWMTHKLSHWHDQFGVSGCVGCGRCIAWCPVGIDITEEARAIADAER